MAADERVLAKAQARIGAVLRGKYRLDRVLGVGGMAAVFAATHRNGKEFAVKLLHPEPSLQADMRARFLREGYVANAVKHAGAVTVIDDDVTEDGSAFLVMELLEGKTVEAVWDEQGRTLDLRVVVAVAMQLLDVLAAAHKNHVVHRDVKPANLFITRDGQLKVLDFGIARIRDMATGFAATQSGFTLGTPAFMAPEQAAGKASEIGPQTDLWSVGATMFTLASGKLMHEAGSQHELLIKAATSPGRPLSSVLPHVPPLLGGIVDRATPYAVADRWANATAMREALRHASIAVYGTPPAAPELAAALDKKQGPVERSAPPAAPASSFPPASPAVVPSVPPTHVVASSGPPGVTGQPVYRSQGAPAVPPHAGIVLVAVGGAFVVIGAIAAAILLSKPSTKPVVADPMPSAPTSVADPLPPPAQAASVPAPPAVSIPPPAPAPSPSVEPAPSAAPPASVAASAAPSAAQVPTSAPVRPAPRPSCSPPYVIDAQGVRKWKRECL